MVKILAKLLSYFDDPNHPTLGPILNELKFICMWSPGRSKLKTIIHFISLLYIDFYVLNLYVYNIIIMKFQFNYFIMFIQFSLAHLAAVKVTLFTINHKKWEEIVKQVSDIENSYDHDHAESFEITENIRKYSKMVMSMMFIIIFTCNISYVSIFAIYQLAIRDIKEPVTGTDNLFNIWLPVDINTRSGRVLDIGLQILFAEYVITYVCSMDSIQLQLMAFFIGQFRALRLRCRHMLDDPDDDVQMRNIIRCHQLYMKLLECHSLVNKMLSPVMCIFLILAMVGYSCIIVYIAQNLNNIMELCTTIEVFVGMSFIFLSNQWIANEVIYQSMEFCYGIFESDWVYSSKRVRRAVLLLSFGMRQRVSFSAGPFNEMSLDTYVAILKMSYSFFTFLTR